MGTAMIYDGVNDPQYVNINDCEELMITWILHTDLGIKTNLYKEFEALQDGKTNEEWTVILKNPEATTRVTTAATDNPKASTEAERNAQG